MGRIIRDIPTEQDKAGWIKRAAAVDLNEYNTDEQVIGAETKWVDTQPQHENRTGTTLGTDGVTRRPTPLAAPVEVANTDTRPAPGTPTNPVREPRANTLSDRARAVGLPGSSTESQVRAEEKKKANRNR